MYKNVQSLCRKENSTNQDIKLSFKGGLTMKKVQQAVLWNRYEYRHFSNIKYSWKFLEMIFNNNFKM